MKKLLSILLVAIIALSAFVGCQAAPAEAPAEEASAAEAPAEEAPAEEAPAEEAPAEEAAPAATGELIDVNGDGKITVAGIHKFGDSLWFVNESAATEARLKELGVDEYTFMDAKDDGNLFLQMIDTASEASALFPSGNTARPQVDPGFCNKQSPRGRKADLAATGVHMIQGALFRLL